MVTNNWLIKSVTASQTGLHGSQMIRVSRRNGSPAEGTYWGADKSLARTGKEQATATENFEFHISHL